MPIDSGTSGNSEEKPIFWEVEDGESVSVDPRDIYKCRVCGNWYRSRTLPDEKKICSPGCSLKLAESNRHTDN